MDGRLNAAGLLRLLGPWQRAGVPAYVALAERIRLLVLDGRVPLRTRLPAERELAAPLGVSRTTVTAAYEQLRQAGFLHSRRGSGTWTTLPDTARTSDGHATPLAPLGTASGIDLAHAAPAALPGAVGAAAARAVEALPRYLPSHGYQLVGLDLLRETVAARLTVRGLPTTRDQVMITAGAQQAIALTLRAMCGPGDRVLVEHPTYPSALDAIRQIGARPVPVALGAQNSDPDTGWDLNTLAATLRDAAPRLAYLVPDFHNPTGLCMPDQHRAAVVELVRRTRTPLIVDETLTELNLDGPAPTPLAAHSAETLPVITLGSASKTFWGGLRVGWLRAPRPLLHRIATTRASLDLASPVLEQLIVAELLDHPEHALSQRRSAMRSTRDALLSLLAEHLPAWTPNHPAGGLSLWVELGAPLSSALTATALRHGVHLAAGPRFGLDGAFERFLRLPYTLSTAQLTDAVSRLATAWQDLATKPPAHPEPTQTV